MSRFAFLELRVEVVIKVLVDVSTRYGTVALHGFGAHLVNVKCYEKKKTDILCEVLSVLSPPISLTGLSLH